MKEWFKKHWKQLSIMTLLLVFVVVISLNSLNSQTDAQVSTDVGLRSMKEYSKVEKVAVNDYMQSVVVTFKHEQHYKNADVDGKFKTFSFSYTAGQRDEVAKILEGGKYASGYQVTRQASSTLSSILVSILPTFILVGLLYWFYKSSMGGGGKQQVIKASEESIRFDDVKGEDTAVSELREIKDMMVHPDSYKQAGAAMPKGILLYGPPGTGKTLIARALAGETKSSFYYANGSSFVEMFVGLGAKRVRSLFETARRNAPSIIFIDEIDAVGGSRGRSSSNSEGDQTLNQLLVEMDGFEANGDVLVVAATNRPDILDKALLRPGRFDRQVEVDIPDMDGREDILRVHSKDKKTADDVDFHWAAQQTSGFSGAQLANVMNEAAVMSVRNEHDAITQADISEGIDRVMAGPQKDKRHDYQSSMRHTAYHEGGHAIVAMSLKNADPVTKVTILPRGRALGYTMISSDDDKTNYTESQIKAQLAYMMGGKAAEELIFGESSTGAGSDIEKAASLARDAVQKYGFSKSMGIGIWDTQEDHATISEYTKSRIDQEIADMLNDAFQTARDSLQKNRESLDALAALLMDEETVSNGELQTIKESVDIIQ